MADGSSASTVARPGQLVEVAPVFVDETPRLMHEFTVVNPFSEAVTVTKVTHTCSCSSAKLAKFELGPAEEATLRIESDLHGRGGRQQFTSRLETKAHSIWAYTVEVDVYSRAYFESESVHAGRVEPNTVVERQAEFRTHARNRNSLPKLVGFKVDRSSVALESGQPIVETLPSSVVRCTTPVKVTIRPESRSGFEHALAHAIVEQSGRQEERRLMVDWIVMSLYEVAPQRAFWAASDPDDTEHRILVRRADGGPFKLVNVMSPSPNVTVRAEPDSQHQIVWLTLRLNRKGLLGAVWGDVILETDDPRQRRLSIPIAVANSMSK